MRVVCISYHACPYRPPGDGLSGGMNTYIRHLAAHLARAGVIVDIFTPSHHDLVTREMMVEPGVVLHHIDTPTEALGGSRGMSSPMEQFVEGVVRRIGPNHSSVVVHSHYWSSALVGESLADLLDAPHVHTFHSLAAGNDHRNFPGGCRCRQEAHTAQSADLVFASTVNEADEVVDRLGAMRSKVAVVRPGVDTRLFRPPLPFVGPSETRSGQRTVVYAGRLTKSKGVDVAIRSYELLARSLTGMRMLIAGGPPEPVSRTDLHAASGRGPGGGDIAFLGKVHQAKLAALFRGADLVLVPSRRESFGFVALEAQASGAPVLASSASGLRTTVGDDSGGLRLATHSPEDWARAAGDILEDPETLERLRDAGPRFASRFSWFDAARETRALYTKMI